MAAYPAIVPNETMATTSISTSHWYLHKFPLSPRGTSGERDGERGIPKSGLLSPALSSFLRQEEREKILQISAFSDVCAY
jgi:hypothetical protein